MGLEVILNRLSSSKVEFKIRYRVRRPYAAEPGSRVHFVVFEVFAMVATGARPLLDNFRVRTCSRFRIS